MSSAGLGSPDLPLPPPPLYPSRLELQNVKNVVLEVEMNITLKDATTGKQAKFTTANSKRKKMKETGHSDY